jgi:hypothetical protein
MNRSSWMKVFAVLLLAAALTGVSVAAAQGEEPTKDNHLGPAIDRVAVAPSAGEALAALQESEPNNTRGGADYLRDAYSFAGFVTGTIGSAGDVDWFTFPGLPGDKIMISIAAWRYGSALDSVVGLYDSAGNLLVENDDVNAEGDYDSYLVYTLTSEDDYYVKVREYSPTEGGPAYWYNLFIWAEQRDDENYGIFYAPGDEEPNNSRGAAHSITYAHTEAYTRIDIPGDVDWFKFDGKAGDLARIKVETTGLHGALHSQLGLYNSAGALLASCTQANWAPNTTNCYLEKTLPKTGTYYLKVSDAQNGGGPDRRYWLELGLGEPFEPNDSIAQATPISYGQAIRGLVAPGDSSDYFRFSGQAGEYVTITGGRYFEILDNAGNYFASNWEEWGKPMSLELPYTGLFYVKTLVFGYLGPFNPQFGDYELLIDRLMLAGVKTDGTVGALSYGKGDILAFLPGSNKWSLFFDGSDVGVKTNVMDFDVVQYEYDGADHPDFLLMSFMTTTKLPTYPGSFNAAPQDIVRFDAWDLSEDTFGRWEMYLDGSDIGLTTSSEMIDAVDLVVSEYDELYFSTTGRATVVPNNGYPPFTAEDEDIIHCSAPGGWETKVNCDLAFDGSAAGIPVAADIASIWRDPETPKWDIYMTFNAATTINGVAYKPNDVAVCVPVSQVHPITSCTWLPKYWAGNAHSLSGKTLDGLTVRLEKPY